MNKVIGILILSSFLGLGLFAQIHTQMSSGNNSSSVSCDGAGACTITVNGSTYQARCESGNISVINADVYCNGRLLSPPAAQPDASVAESGCGMIPAHHHINPNGSEGGWVANRMSVERSVSIDPAALVCGTGWIRGNAVLRGPIRISGSVHLSDTTILQGGIDISGDLETRGLVKISGRFNISGEGTMHGYSVSERRGITLNGAGNISGQFDLSGMVTIDGSPMVSGRLVAGSGSRIHGSPLISGDLTMRNGSVIEGAPLISGDVELNHFRILRNMILSDDAHLSDGEMR